MLADTSGVKFLVGNSPVLGFFLAALCSVFVFCGYLGCSRSASEASVYFITTQGRETPAIKVEIAKTPGERKLGMMYRKELAEDRGMLFIFPEETELSFWMKNTYIELDIIFINSAHEVVSVTRRAIPHSETARRSEGPARFVLEVRGGLAEKWGLDKGSKLVTSEGVLQK